MDLKNAQAVLAPAEGKSFDPAKIPQAVRKAGFAAGEIEVTAAGRLTIEDDSLRLEMPGPVEQLILAGGAKAEKLRKRPDLIGRRLSVTGVLHPSQAEKPPGITVERWELAD